MEITCFLLLCRCSKRFNLKSTLSFHLRTHDDAEVRRAASIACHLCPALFSKRSALKAHLRLHTGGRPYRCDVGACQERFRTPALRRAHVERAHHKKDDAQTHPPSSGLESSSSSSLPPMHISVPASSLTSALGAVSDIGVPLVGSTLKLQLDFGPGGGGGAVGVGSTVTHLKVDEPLLKQLALGGNVSLVIHPQQDGQQQQQQQQAQPQPQSALQTAAASSTPALPTTSSETTNANPEESNKGLRIQSSPKREKEAATDRIKIVSPFKCVSTGVLEATKAVESETEEKAPPKKPRPPPPPTAGSSEMTTVFVTGTSCPFCSKSFPKPTQLRRHLRVHTREKPYVCDDCGRCFSQSNSLNAHLRAVHRGERPYKCPFCDLAVAQKCNLKTHIRRAHEEQAKRLVEVTGLAQDA